MSYPDGEALILTALQLHANYSSNNTSRGDWKILNSGNDARYVVLRMGIGNNAPHAMSSVLTTWTTQLMLYRSYTDDGTTAIALQGDMQTVLEHMEQYESLGDAENTVVDAQITNISEMQEVQMFENGPVYLRTIIDMVWQEQRNVTYI